MISVEKALEIILSDITIKDTEIVNIFEAFRRVLGEDIISDINIPFDTNSAMDGYAVIASDTQNATNEEAVKLILLDQIPAGKVSSAMIQSGSSCKIMTGAPLPIGADAVVMREMTEEKDNYVLIKKSVKQGENVRYAGEDVKQGEKILLKGNFIYPSDIGMLATLGYKKVAGYKKPVVGIISTGDEIIEIDETIKPGYVRNSNSYSLYALVQEIGAAPIYFGILKDKKNVIRDGIKNAVARCDIVFTSGGVSVGDWDEVKGVVEEIGDVKFWKVAMKPGKPTLFGKVENKPIFGLPGNPASAMVVFDVLVKPAILKMMGLNEQKVNNLSIQNKFYVELAEDIKEKEGRKKFIRGIIYNADGKLLVKSAGLQGAGILKSMVMANCYIVLPENAGKINKKEMVTVCPFFGRLPGSG